MVRPGPAPCDTWPALAWDRAAPRGSRPDPLATVMGSVEPARRLHALRASRRSAPRAACAVRRPSSCFRFPSEVHRSTPAPSRRPRPTRQTMLPLLGFRAVRHVPGRRIRCARGVQPRTVPRARFGHLLRDVHHRPSRRLAASERPSASPFKAFSSRRSGPLSGASCPPGVARVASPRPHGERANAVDFRALIPTRARSVRPVPRDTTRRCLPGIPPSRAFSLSPLRTRFAFARDPLTRRVGSTSRSVRVSGCCGGARSAGPSRDCRLSWALLTLRPPRHRCDRIGGRAHGFASRCARVAGGASLSVPPRRRSGRSSRPGPMPASFGERLLPVPFVRACCQRTGSPSPIACRTTVPIGDRDERPANPLGEQRLARFTSRGEGDRPQTHGGRNGAWKPQPGGANPVESPHNPLLSQDLLHGKARACRWARGFPAFPGSSPPTPHRGVGAPGNPLPAARTHRSAGLRDRPPGGAGSPAPPWEIQPFARPRGILAGTALRIRPREGPHAASRQRKSSRRKPWRRILL